MEVLASLSTVADSICKLSIIKSNTKTELLHENVIVTTLLLYENVIEITLFCILIEITLFYVIMI